MSVPERRLSASSRVILAMAGVLAFSVAVLSVVAFMAGRGTLTASLDSALRSEANAFAAAMASAPSEQALVDATREYLSQRSSEGSGFDPILSVVFTSGHSISNSDVRLESVPPTNPTSAQGVEAGFATVVLSGERYRVLSVPVTSRDGFAGTFRAALSADSVSRVARGIAMSLASAGLIVLALGLPLSYLATRRALSPLTRMAEDAAQISETSERREIAYDGPPDELGVLARALNAMLSRLEESAASQRAFIADASHELRTPVAVVRGNVDLLQAGTLSREDQLEALQMISVEAERMSRLLDELLALARLEATGRPAFQPLFVPVMLDEAAARGRRLGGCEFVVRCAEQAWVSGEPDLLDRAFANLVRNASSHSPCDSPAVISCEATSTMVSISVTDDGPGIPEEELPRVFDRFYRAQSVKRDGTTGGAGLGLAIVKRIAELHGGSVSVENVEQHGARVTLTLPRIPAPPE